MQRSGSTGGSPETMLWLIIFLMISVCVVALCSCSPKTQIEYVDREVVKYEKQYVYDTTYLEKHDSVLHTIFQKGDTVYDTQYIVRVKYKDRVVYRADTCYRDSIQTEYKETVKEKSVIPKWCYYTLVAWLVIILFVGIKVYRWTRIG